MVAAETHREGAGAGGAAHIGRDDHDILVVLAEFLDVVLDEDVGTGQVIDRNVKKALDLGCVQVHGQDSVRPGGGDEVGDELGGDGVAALGFAVLPGVAEIGDDRSDAAGGGAAHSVDHDEQLHQMVVYGAAGGLDDEHVLAADRLVHGDGAFAVRKL